jgi:phosphomannomutase/phosphoglucomutase
MSKPSLKKRPAKPQRTLRFSANQRDIVLSALLSIGAVVAAFYWLQNVEIPRTQTQRIATITTNIADQQRSLSQGLLNQLRTRIVKQLENPALHATLAAADTKQRDLEELALRRAFPEALDAKILLVGPQGIADERTETARLRNNIEIDMLRKTLLSKGIIMEAYSHKKQWLVSITGVAGKHGALFVTFDADFFTDLFKKIAGSTAIIELSQTYNTRKDVIIPDAGNPNSNSGQTRKLSIPGWSINVYPQQDIVHSLSEEPTLVWLMCLFCIALISGSHVIFFLRSYQILLAEPKVAVPANDEAILPDLEQALAQKLSINRTSNLSQHANFTAPNSAPPLPDTGSPSKPLRLSTNSFRAYDIRGVAKSELDDASCHAIGQAIGSEALNGKQGKILLARDGRLSSPRIHKSLLQGLLSTGIDVIDLGLIATPMLHYGSYHLNIGNTVMITGSHNPSHYNGMKIGLDFQSLSSNDIQSLRHRIESQNFVQGKGTLSNDSIEQRYIERISSDVVIAQTLKVVIDAGNGASANIAPALFEELGCEVVPLFCEIDGNFPNHPPDPTVAENLSALRAAVAEHNADIGIAFDGDADRIAVVSAKGICPNADQLLMILAQDIVIRNPGAEILFDVKCTRLLPELISEHGGRPTMWKCGHSYMKRKMLETGALLGGEFSGHIFYKERWYGFDDGMYTAARLLEILSLAGNSLDDLLDQQKNLYSSPEILLAVADENKFSIVETFKEHQNFSDATLSNIDGLRVDFSDGWGLIRASNTGPAITLRFEADTQEALQRIKNDFLQLLTKIDPRLVVSL